LFLFAVAVIQAHSIIPHHHHAEPNAYGCTQPAASNKDKPVEAPWHCQALNQIVFVDKQVLCKSKQVTPFPADPLPSSCRSVIACPAAESYLPIYPLLPAYHNPLMLPVPGRAPPEFTGV